MAMGVIAGIIWLIRRLTYPEKFKLGRTPGRKNRLDPLLLLAAVMLIYMLCQAAGFGLVKWLTPHFGEDHAELLAVASLPLILIPAWILLGHWGFSRGAFLGMGLSVRHWPAGVLRGVITALIALPVCFLLQFGITAAAGALGIDPGSEHPLITTFQKASVGWRWLVAIFVVVLGPIAEELLFRGLCQSTLRRVFGKPWPAIVVTSVLFGAMHYNVWTSVLPLAAFAAMLGYSYERTGKLLSPIIAHAVFNGLFLLGSLPTA